MTFILFEGFVWIRVDGTINHVLKSHEFFVVFLIHLKSFKYNVLIDLEVFFLDIFKYNSLWKYC